MRRGPRALAVALLAMVTAVSLSACNSPSVGDHDIGGDWVLFDEPKVPAPDNGVCRTGSVEWVDFDLSIFNAAPGECTTSHQTETFFIGKFTGKNASGTSAPDVGDAAFKSASQTCDREAEKFLGGDWHKARAELVAVMPTDTQWHGEARWFRCELMETKDSQGHVVARSTSMKNGLRGKKPLAITCANYTSTKDGQGFTNITYRTCSKSHAIEMTGTYTWTASKFPGKKQSNTNSSHCLAVGAKYLGTTVGGLNSVGGFEWLWWPASEAQWSVGNKTVRCYIGAYPSHKRTGSVKGKGAGAL
jgi:hypothetical protein